MTSDCTSIPQTAIPGPNKCPYDQWNPTVSNWMDANVDGELSSFFLNQVPDAPTYIKGTYPTKLPQIGTGPGSNEQAVGYPGKLIAAAAGDESVDCSDVIGGMAGCHPPPSVNDACKVSPFNDTIHFAFVILTKKRRQHATLGLLSLGIYLEHGFHTCSDICKLLTMTYSNLK